ncbi:GDP-mannose 4,6-dehydratase [Brevundimonas sp.]|uniref:GDP-mannose 4,6-dehydratase n=1 Tax=Brevundimonas sp. TaxID=1871086 RepID=UPI003F71113D
MASPSRVLITGISGFTGLHLSNRLLAEGCEVFGLANSHDGVHVPSLCADLGETDGIADWIHSIQPTHVVHLAALSHVVGPALPFYQVNVLGTESLLEAIRRAEVRPEKVLIASSANIYGQTRVSPISEDEPPLPANHYAASKAAMEWIARQWFERFPIIVTRPFNYTGAGQSEAFLFAKLAGAFHRRVPVLSLGNVRVARDLSDVSFVTEAYHRLLMSDLASTTLNICSGRSVAISEALAILRDLTGHDPEVTIDSALLRPNDVEVLTGDPTRLQAAIGPIMPVAPEEIFRRMVATLESGPA